MKALQALILWTFAAAAAAGVGLAVARYVSRSFAAIAEMIPTPR